MDPWYQRLWKSITRIFRIGEKETFTHVDMIECMDGKPLSDQSIQDCLFNNPPPLPEKTLPRPMEGMKPVFLPLPPENQILYENYSMSFSCTPENEASSPKGLKDSLDEPESVLETFARKRNERFKRDVCMDFIMRVEPTIPSEK
ncbi:hypothetical protein TNCV_5005151 [Trichonephila clavipes]|uniref:Uncharacterized protein n=1 Tax=Trichonephila clavipes TaxID=2585209 RepID=A0A8X6RBH5_TRICX|nr:hypothetical protein TNCV_5005151 [Trichonephila clavipes]